jgi:hypothetical protein
MTRSLIGLILLTLAAEPKPDDRHGDFVKQGEFKGKKILFVNYDSVEPNEKYVPDVLRKMGFTVEVRVAPEKLPDLMAYDQLWMVSSCGDSGKFGAADVERIVKFTRAGKGFYSLSDNVPCITQGSMVGKALHGIELSGDYQGEKTIHVVPPGTIKKMVDEAFAKDDYGKLAELRRAGYLNGKLYAEDHELLSGITTIYEGITLCHMSDSPDLEVILRASDNQSLVAVSTREGERVVHDCGFTRLFYRWEEHAATSTQWYQNVAAYLMGKQRADLPKTVATERPTKR